MIDPVPYIASPTATNLRDALIAAGIMQTGEAATGPANTVAPVVTGSTTVGSVLTCSAGTWTGTAPITYAYQWRVGGVDIIGANASTYDTSAQDAGAAINCSVTATNSAGSDEVSSNTIVLTEEAPPATAPAAPALGRIVPSIGGTWPASGGRAIASRFTLAGAASTIAYWQHFGNGGAAGDTTAGRTWRGMVYADAAGQPGALLHSSATALTRAEGGWHQAPLAVALAAGNYWLATIVSDFGVTINSATVANGGAAGNVRLGEGAGTPAAPGNPFPSGASAYDGSLSACVTYTPAG